MNESKEVKGKSDNDTDNLPDKPETETPPSREQLFAQAYISCRNIRQAGTEAGYAKSVIRTTYLRDKFKVKRFQELLRSLLTAKDFEHVIMTYQLEGLALEEALEQAKTDRKTAITNIDKLRHVSTLMLTKTDPSLLR